MGCARSRCRRDVPPALTYSVVQSPLERQKRWLASTPVGSVEHNTFLRIQKMLLDLGCDPTREDLCIVVEGSADKLRITELERCFSFAVSSKTSDFTIYFILTRWVVERFGQMRAAYSFIVQHYLSESKAISPEGNHLAGLLSHAIRRYSFTRVRWQSSQILQENLEYKNIVKALLQALATVRIDVFLRITRYSSTHYTLDMRFQRDGVKLGEDHRVTTGCSIDLAQEINHNCQLITSPNFKYVLIDAPKE